MWKRKYEFTIREPEIQIYANRYLVMEQFPELILSILSGVFSGVIVSLVTMWLAERKRSEHERRMEARRREAVLSAIGRELQWNRTATRGKLDVSNAHYIIGKLVTVAFERHGADLAIIAPSSVESVFKHYATVDTVKEGIRTIAVMPDREADERLKMQWIDLSEQASVEVSNTAMQALKILGSSLEPEDGSAEMDDRR